MTKKVSLSEYVRKRNGIPLGGKGSLSNMLKRSLGAESFHQFWQYWNPIWGYYLSTKIMKPLSKVLPTWLAIIFTFSVSGALHDLAVILLKQQAVFLFTPWFSLMGFVVVISKVINIRIKDTPWPIRAIANISLIVLCFYSSSYIMLLF